jgi:signal transduction histidine kinase
MQMPQDNFVKAVERMGHALEPLVSAPSSLAMLLQEVVCCAATAVGLERVAVAWVGSEGELRTQTTSGLSPEAVAACGRGLLDALGGAKAPWLPPVERIVSSRLGGASALVQPVPGARGGCVGVLLGCSAEPRGFSAEETRRFALHARLVGLVIEHARPGGAAPEDTGPGETPRHPRAQASEAERVARLQAEAAALRLRLLADAGTVLSSSLEWETTVASVAQLVVGAFADWCAVDFLDEHGALRRLTVRHARPERTLSNSGLEAFTPERVRPSAITEVVRTGRAQLVTGLVPPGAGAATPEDGGSAGGSFLVVPLRARQRTLGALSFVRGPHSAPFCEADRSLAEDLGARVGLAIDHARLLRKSRAAEAESRRNAARLRILVDVDHLLAQAGLDLPTVLDVIAQKVSEVIGDGCVLQLTSEEDASLEPVTFHHPDPEARWLLAGTVHARRQWAGEGLHGGVALRGHAVLLPDIDAEAARASGGLPEYLPYLERYGAQSLLVVPLRAQGRVFGTLGVVRDVAGGCQPYAEEDRLLLQSLAERAALAIADARLYGAATEAVRLRDDFLSVAGHELKTPLSAMRLQIQMLARMTRDVATAPDIAERVTRAERASERLGALVDELLDVGRITAGRLELKREELDLTALTREVMGRMSEAFLRSGSEVRLVAEAAVVGRWDRVRLEQVLCNLLSNAVKYGRGRPVEVRVEERGPEGARLVVRDGGIGIAPEDQPRIFERFERAVTDKQFHGLGLGLWITREIIDAHEGSIEVHSVPGEGSTFIVVLPRG